MVMEKLVHKGDNFDEAFSAMFKNNKDHKLLNDVYLQELEFIRSG